MTKYEMAEQLINDESWVYEMSRELEKDGVIVDDDVLWNHAVYSAKHYEGVE